MGRDYIHSRGDSMKKFCLIAVMVMIGGCARHVVDVKTLTIQPQEGPVTVTIKGTATLTDYFLFYRIQELVEVKSSDGSKAQRLQ
jgi:hypothetical protein